MNARAAMVPAWVRVATSVLALMNIAFGVMGFVRTEVLFPELGAVPDLVASEPLLVHASREFSSRNLAIGLALLLVSRVGVPESIAIVTLIRALIEAQTIVLTIAEGHVGLGLALPVVLLVAELFVVQTMFGVLRRHESRANPPASPTNSP